MKQRIITAKDDYQELDAWIGDKRVFLVCDPSLQYLTGIKTHLEALEQAGKRIVRFSDFKPNPLYSSVAEGVERFHAESCEAIMAVGGGSAMDVAKCIKLFSNMDRSKNYLQQAIVPNSIPFLAMPTTAGTGSEATRYAVIYFEGKKQSVTHESCIPTVVLMDSGALRTLPDYQKKATMLDALCHAIESYWSVNSTEESKAYSREAIKQIMSSMKGYLGNTDEGNAGMLLAANTAGKAINITQTTAGHAMCYQITSLFGCAHGHAAALCVRKLFPWMIENLDLCIDPRGKEYLSATLNEIAEAMGCKVPASASSQFEQLIVDLGLTIPTATEEQFALLKTSVNPVRLKNHPIALNEEAIDQLYHEILR